MGSGLGRCGQGHVSFPKSDPRRVVFPHMLDINILRKDPAAIVRLLELRGHVSGKPQKLVDDLVALDRRYRLSLQETEELRRRQKKLSTRVRDAQGEQKSLLLEEAKDLRKKVWESRDRAIWYQERFDQIWSCIPNLLPENPPSEMRVVRDWGTKKEAVRDHVELGLGLDLVDFERGAKVAGQKFYYLKNEAVFLELALQQFALQQAQKHGFVVHSTPDLTRPKIVEGLGFSPRSEADQIYHVSDHDLCLVGTAEITLGGMYQDEILEASQLPLLLAGVSHCFRTEAGSAGRESRGLYRVHQFSKVELFVICTPEQSDEMLLKLVGIEEEVLRSLGLAYRVVEMPPSDLGAPAYQKYDIEAWMPGRQDYGEVTSASNCLDYQARRLGIRYRPTPTSKPQFVHTLNATAVAVPRMLIAIFESYQQKNGTVLKVPSVLEPWVGTGWIESKQMIQIEEGFDGKPSL